MPVFSAQHAGKTWSGELDSLCFRLSWARIGSVTLGQSLSLLEPQASHL